MVNNNGIPFEVKKPFETAYGLKNEYEVKKSPLSPAARAKVNNRSGGNYVSDNKEGYGPCSSCVGKSDIESNGSTGFKLEIRLKNALGGEIVRTVYSVEQAQVASTEIYYSSGYWGGNLNTGFFTDSERLRLARNILLVVNQHEEQGWNIDTVVSNKSSHDDGCFVM